MIKQVLSDDIIKQYLPILTACPLFNTLGIPELTSYLHNAKVIIKNIMANLEASSIFGEALLFSKHPLWPATIKALKPTKIMFIPLETFIETLPDCQQCQTKILSNLLEDLSEKALLLTKKVHYLTLKGMREKIYAYLTDIYTMQHSEKLVLPHNREQMAEALNVSRTALSRELGRLRDEGIIEINGRHVTLLDPQQIVEFGFNN